MLSNNSKFVAAAVQASPIFLNKGETIKKACKLIKEAGNSGARLVVFPETYLPAYPYWPRDFLKQRALSIKTFVTLFKNSIEIPSKDTDILCEAAKKARAYVAIGVNEKNEKFNGTLYNTILYISNDGKIMGKHRKLVPTFSERCIWGQGDGSDLNVFETSLGNLGGLICYEHFMTLSKYAMFAKGEQIHVAVWPGYSRIKTNIDLVSRQYALEGQVFVIVSCCYMNEAMIPDSFELKKQSEWDIAGGSGIIDPHGHYIAGPIYDKEELVYAEIDLTQIIEAKVMVDAVGHYARWDVTTLNLNEEKRTPIKIPKGEEAARLQKSNFDLTVDSPMEIREEIGFQRRKEGKKRI